MIDCLQHLHNWQKLISEQLRLNSILKMIVRLSGLISAESLIRSIISIIKGFQPFYSDTEPHLLTESNVFHSSNYSRNKLNAICNVEMTRMLSFEFQFA